VRETAASSDYDLPTVIENYDEIAAVPQLAPYLD